MWPFARKKKEKVELPEFGTINECPACGSQDFARKYDDGWFADDWYWPPFIRVECKCGWWRGEKLKIQSTMTKDEEAAEAAARG